MCLILLAWHVHPAYPLVLVANRDEFFARPTASARFWPEAPQLLAGRDLQAGGTWLGLTRTGRFAALTNYREPENQTLVETHSRGHLVRAFLTGTQSAEAYLNELTTQASDYRAFNLICGTLTGKLYHYSNRDPSGTPVARLLVPGLHGLSNHVLDTPWPKLVRGKHALGQALNTLPDETPLFGLLQDETRPDDADLPKTGVSLEWERMLSSACIRAPHYGTRSSTILLYDRQGMVSFDERSIPPADAVTLPQAQRQRFRFRLPEPMPEPE